MTMKFLLDVGIHKEARIKKKNIFSMLLLLKNDNLTYLAFTDQNPKNPDS